MGDGSYLQAGGLLKVKEEGHTDLDKKFRKCTEQYRKASLAELSPPQNCQDLESNTSPPLLLVTERMVLFVVFAIFECVEFRKSIKLEAQELSMIANPNLCALDIGWSW